MEVPISKIYVKDKRNINVFSFRNLLKVKL